MSIKVASVPNNEQGIAYINELKKQTRYINRYRSYTIRVRTYGRCFDKVAAFKQTGRYHCSNSNSNSIYSLKSKEAPFCYEWAVYLEITPKKVKSQAYPDGNDDTNKY
jgi:hypothetical protein